MIKSSRHLAWLKNLSFEDQSLFGSKAAGLGELLSLEINAPQGFALSKNVYFAFIKENNLGKKIKDQLLLVDHRDPHSLETISRKIRQIFQDCSFPLGLAKEIIDAYFRLGTPLKDVSVALRSSIITRQALPYQATFLNVKGEANVIEFLKDCFSSLFSPGNLIYFSSNFYLPEYSVSVLIQKMVPAQKSGLLFTHDFLRYQKNVCLIEALKGLGEVAVQKNIIPDQYFVHKQTLKIQDKIIEKQPYILKANQGIFHFIKQSSSSQNKQKISDQEIISLAKLAKKIQSHYFFPQEIEWAISKKQIYILQTKPLNQPFQNQTSNQTSQSKDYPRLHQRKILARGKSVFPGIVTGFSRHLSSLSDSDQIKNGEILITNNFLLKNKNLLKKAAALICEDSKNSTHQQLIAYEMGLPWINSVDKARQIIKNNMAITVDAKNGLIFKTI